MQQPRNITPQEVPAGFADKLREMRNTGDPRLNAVLAAARTNGWRTATLAEVLKMNPTATSKRIERAVSPAPETVARQALRTAATKMSEIGFPVPSAQLAQLSSRDQPTVGLASGLDILESVSSTKRQLKTAKRAVQKAIDYRQTEAVDISGVEIPSPPERIPAMMNGQRLTLAEIQDLKEMQVVSARVNGALPAGHEYRKVSEKYSAKLHQLISKRGFTPYYLARELGVTHRAITSRLERHGFRTPCPSVQGTPSGVYRGRKIGEHLTEQDG